LLANPGQQVTVQTGKASAQPDQREWLPEEVATSLNLMASGDHANLVTIGVSSAFPSDTVWDPAQSGPASKC
jgi:LAS superfamily LD-carboxypeptidase LdcB